MTLDSSILSRPQAVAPPPIPFLTARSERIGTDVALGLQQTALWRQPNILQLRSETDHLQTQLGLGKTVVSGTPSPAQEARLSWLSEPAPNSVAALLESMVRQFLARDHVASARTLLQALPRGGSESPSLRRLRLVLSEPHLQRRSVPRPGGAADLDWLGRNASAYRGRWVAVANGTLLDDDLSLEVLLKRLRRTFPSAAPLLHRL